MLLSSMMTSDFIFMHDKGDLYGISCNPIGKTHADLSRHHPAACRMAVLSQEKDFSCLLHRADCRLAVFLVFS